MPFRRPKRVLEFQQPARVATLDSDRRQFWKSIADRDERPLYRSETLNLIAAGPIADATLLQATCRRLIEQHPCTVFLVLLSGGRHPLTAQWGARVLESEHSQTVLAEELVLQVGVQDRVLLPSLIRPLLSGDVPSVTFWSAELPRDPSVVDALASMTDELIFDSALLHDPVRDIRRLRSCRPDIRDLTWQRIAPWRRALAEAFEHVLWSGPETARATIQHVGSAGSSAAAAALGEWIGERLGAEISPVVRPRCHAPSFEPCRLTLDLSDGRIDIVHEWPQPRLRIEVDGKAQAFHAAAPGLGRGPLLAEAIEQLCTTGRASRIPAGVAESPEEV